MLSRVLKVLAALNLAGCAAGTPDNSALSLYGGLRVKLTDGSASASQFSALSRILTASASTPNVLGGLYFGELEIIAFNYRPGESVQNHDSGNGWNGADWSYWVLLKAGYLETRNLLLKPGQSLDFDSLNNSYRNYLGRESSIDPAFAEEVKSFGVDMLEVHTFRTGVIWDNEYWGSSDTGPDDSSSTYPTTMFYRYPEFGSVPQVWSPPFFPGVADWQNNVVTPINAAHVSILFARRDWFPEATTVSWGPGRTDDDPTQTSALHITHTSRPLTVAQTTILNSWLEQSPRGGSDYHFIVVPFDRTEIALTSDALDLPGVKPSQSARISLDLTQVLDPTTVFELAPLGAPWTGTNAKIKYQGDANNVPFGLSVSWEDVPSGE
jgi:hypothetical protein